MTKIPDAYRQAAELISGASVIIITAGAGIGVDSGLPDFRGNHGFWKAYPMYERLGLSFIQAANPEHFERDPNFGWGFYGHRTNLYRQTVPHAGFQILRGWIESFALESFVVTSNVDGQFQKAGFSEDRILEVHGSIHHLQCTTPCCTDIWSNEEQLIIDEKSMRAKESPDCPHCHRVARPNILMFGDYSWLHQRTAKQESRFERFLTENSHRTTVVIEAGAGSAIPTIRNLSESLGQRQHTTVLRVNPREPQIDAPHISFTGGSLDVLERLQFALNTL